MLQIVKRDKRSYQIRTGKFSRHTIYLTATICLVVESLMGQNTAGGYSYGNMGLAATCDFEWSMCGWTQEPSPADQMDWRRQRGPGGTGWYKIQGDHTPGKDGFGFYMYIDGADFRRPLPVDPDSIDVPEPDELLAQQTGIASRSIAGKPSVGPLNRPSSLVMGRSDTMLQAKTRSAFLISPPVAAYLYGQNYASQLGSYTANLNHYPSSAAPSAYQSGGYRSPYPDYGTNGPAPSMDTNSDVKPYDLPGYNYGMPDPVYPVPAAAAPHGGQSHLPGYGHSPYHHQRHLDAQPHAQLIGPRVESPINLTLKFWYHMRGSSVGRLTLYKKVLARPDQIIWERNGQQSFEWTEAQVQLERGTFQLMFEGTINPRMPPNGGYIGLDDFLLEREADLPILMRSQSMWSTAESRVSNPPAHRTYQITSSAAGMPPSNGIIPVHSSPHQQSRVPAPQPVFAKTGGIEISPPADVNRHPSEGQSPDPAPPMPTMQYPPLRPTGYPLVPADHIPNQLDAGNPSSSNNSLLSSDGIQLFPKYSTPAMVRPTDSSSRSVTSRGTTVPLSSPTTTTTVALSTSTSLLITESEPNAGINSFGIGESGNNLKRRKDYTVPPEFLPIPKSITSENPMRKYVDLDLLPLDPTEVSAVVQPQDNINGMKLFAIIASCFGIAGLVVVIAFFVKRGSCGFYSLVPCLNQELGTEATSASESSRSATGRRTTGLPSRPRRPAPPPPRIARRH